MAPPALWSGPRPTRPAARSRPPRAETLPLPATCCWPGSLLRSHPDQPSHGRGNASSRPFGNGCWGGLPQWSRPRRLSRQYYSHCRTCCSAIIDRKRCSTTAGLHWQQLAEGRRSLRCKKSQRIGLPRGGVRNRDDPRPVQAPRRSLEIALPDGTAFDQLAKD